MSNLYDLIGIPFKDKGRDYSGYDCMGLAVTAHKNLGVDIPDFLIDSDSDSEINKKFIEQLFSDSWERIEKPEVPCIVVFGFNQQDRNMVTHVGTYIGDNKILHTLEGKSSSLVDINHPFFKNKILGFYKYEQN